MALKLKEKWAALKPKRLPRLGLKLSGLLLWRLGLIAMALLCLTLGAMLWLSGISDTQHAFHDGRRLLIKLEDGSIEGRITSLEQKEAVPAVPVEPAPATPGPVAETPPAAATPDAPPESVSETPKAQAQEQEPSPDAPEPVANAEPARVFENIAAPTAPLLDNSNPVKPASVPLAAVSQSMGEKTIAGVLPMIGPDGAKPWRYYGKPYERKGSLPMIAIIVTGLGQNKDVSDGALRLPENITLSFSPYAKDIASWATSARIAGHEIMIDLPLEPSNYPASDPGPYGLLVSKGTHENASRLQWLMSRVQGYAGFVTPQNEIFSTNEDSLKALLQSLANRGLMVVFGHDPAKSEIKQVIDTSPTANLIGDVLIDEELSATSIQARFISLEKAASKRGFAVGIAQSYPLTIQQLNLWAAKLQERGFMLVPVTFLAKQKFS